MSSNRVCRHFASTGHCRFGEKCRFVHSTEDAPASPIASAQSGLRQSTQSQHPCRFFLQGNCYKGDQCEWSHEFKVRTSFLQSSPTPATHANGGSIMRTSSQSSSVMSLSTPSRESQPNTPAASISRELANGAPETPDAELTAKVEQQAKQIEEQKAMIKTLNKRLSHCESDLQAHMVIISTLESSLSDSEKNLRKARTEFARERDSLNSHIEALKDDLNQAKHEVAFARRSIVEEKQSLEQRLDEERKAKERVRQQLDSRMEELQRRKSKFACL
ncbi:hypothetical protein APHAL10511_001535 [Amanita phalloides]|nr:hypothetical protein APHAL10511_001535 [Amanita phalloides]